MIFAFKIHLVNSTTKNEMISRVIFTKRALFKRFKQTSINYIFFVACKAKLNEHVFMVMLYMPKNDSTSVHPVIYVHCTVYCTYRDDEGKLKLF